MRPQSLTLLLAAIFLTRINTYAQDQNPDYAYLNNGGIIKGRIIELVPSGSVKIRTADGSIFVYDMSLVARLVFHSEAEDLRSSRSQTVRGNLTIGGSLLYERTFSDGSGTTLVSLTPSVGWFVTDNFLLGIDVSYQGQSYSYRYCWGGYKWDWHLNFGPTLELYFGSSSNKPFLNVTYLFSTGTGLSSQALGFGLGYNVRLSRNIALQPIVQYQLLAPNGVALGQTGELTVGMGLRDFIF